MPKGWKESITVLVSILGIAGSVLAILLGMLTELAENWDTLQIAGVVGIVSNAIMMILRLKTSRPIEGTKAAQTLERLRR